MQPLPALIPADSRRPRCTESPWALDKWIQVALARMARQGSQLWLQVFDDIRIGDDKHLEILYFMFSSMSGIVSFSRIVGKEHRAALIDSNLCTLKELLLARVSGGEAKSGARR